MKILQIFLATFLAGSFTFGGGYALIPIIKTNFVDKLKWVQPKEFGYAIAVGQMTPGPLSTFVAFLGWKIAGIWGAVAATAGLFLPDFLAVILITPVYERVKNHPRVQGIFTAIQPVIGALILSVAVDLFHSIFQIGFLPLGIGIGSFLLLSFTRLNPGWLFLGCILSAFFMHGK